MTIGFGTDRSWAARLVDPPSITLAKGRQQVVRASIQGKLEPDKLRLSVLETLWGEAPQEVTLRVGAETYDRIAAGETYVVAYSSLRKHPLLRDVLQEDPEGPKAVRLLLVGDIVVPDSQALRLILRSAHPEGQAMSRRDILRAALQLLQAEDPASRRLANLEIFTRADLRQAADAEAQGKVERALRGGHLAADEKDFLLQGFLLLPKEQRGTWMAETSRRILRQSTPRMVLTSTEPSLVQTALRVLAEDGRAKDRSRIRPFLYSNSPGVAKAALAALGTLVPDLARSDARKALEGDGVHAETRRALMRFLED